MWLLFLFLTQLSTWQSQKIEMQTPSSQSKNCKSLDLQGHRGCRGLLPENTIPAMLHAIDLGVNTLELDVVITKDSVVLVSHEAYMNYEISTPPGAQNITASNQQQYNIFQMTLAEVQRWDVGLKPHSRFPQQQKIAAVKPSLLQLIEAVENYTTSRHLPPMRYNMEIKSEPDKDHIFQPPPGDFVKLVMQDLQSKNITRRCNIQSFDARILQEMHRRYPAVTLAFLVEDTDARSPAQQVADLGFKPDIYSPHFSTLSAAVVAQMHQHNIRVIPWTVNELSQMQQLVAMGVDGLISDYPQLYQQL